MKKIKNDLGERQQMTRKDVLDLERSFIRLEHFRRYAAVRRFCYGKVLDFASGTGYGSFILSASDFVKEVVGADLDPNAIKTAKKEFSNGKTKFVETDAAKLNEKFDTLVSLETIEHIKEKGTIPALVKRCKIDNVIVSFPDKKTTHYNKYHLHDYVRQDISDLFPEHVVYHLIKSFDSLIVLLVRLPEKAPSDIFRNIRDL